MSALSPTKATEGSEEMNADVRRSCHHRSAEGGNAVVLPGYDAGSTVSGVQHSRSKLKFSAEKLSRRLKEIYDSHRSHLSPLPLLTDERSTSTSTSTSISTPSHYHQSMVDGMNGSIQTFNCLEEEETWTYRCRCNFQIVRVTDEGVTVTTVKPTSSAPMSYRYAMRSKGKPVLLGTRNSFPIGTRRIQAAMHGLMEHLNQNNRTIDSCLAPNTDIADGIRDGEDLIGLHGHLTSCTFSSAWRDVTDADCVLTLHYDLPLDSDETQKNIWTQQARLLCQRLRLRQLNGRSKGTIISVRGGEIYENRSDDVPEIDDDREQAVEEATIRDTIYLFRGNFDSNKNENESASKREEWRVGLEDQVHPNTSAADKIPVHYEKPETAFYHPNPNAMTTALAWMLNRLASIASSTSTQTETLDLLEMYCGCGAHTVALGRSALVSKILAIELDPRLVRACETNVAKNALEDVVEVRRGDAGRWAKEESRKRRSRYRKNLATGTESDRETGKNKENSYDVLLVDPPRQGLDEEVCKMAMMTVDGEAGGTDGESCFRNVLYVSCGHEALLRDLGRLSPVYEVVNCAQMDLFPRTDSIETLVHLRRRELRYQC